MAGDIIQHPSTIVHTAPQAHMMPKNLNEAMRMAEVIAGSRLFGCKTPEEAFSLMLLADAEGLHPAAAARDYHIIEGKPSLKADAMLARYHAAGGKVEWVERTDQRVAANFTHASSGAVPIEWTWDRASKVKSYNRKKQAWESLTDKQVWKNYPCQMLTARTISEGVRVSFPAIVAGVYTPEEVQDFGDEPPKDMQALPPQEAPVNEVPKASRDQAKDHERKKAIDQATIIVSKIDCCQNASELIALVGDPSIKRSMDVLREKFPDVYDRLANKRAAKADAFHAEAGAAE